MGRDAPHTCSSTPPTRTLVKKEELPKSYEDFLDPKWKGRLGIEAEDVDWFAMVIKEIGEDKGLTLFRAIVARNGLSVRRGHTLLAGLVASGEVPFALTVYNHNAEKLKQRGRAGGLYAIQPAIAAGQRRRALQETGTPACGSAVLRFHARRGAGDPGPGELRADQPQGGSRRRKSLAPEIRRSCSDAGREHEVGKTSTPRS